MYKKYNYGTYRKEFTNLLRKRLTAKDKIRYHKKKVSEWRKKFKQIEKEIKKLEEIIENKI